MCSNNSHFDQPIKVNNYVYNYLDKEVCTNSLLLMELTVYTTVVKIKTTKAPFLSTCTYICNPISACIIHVSMHIVISVCFRQCIFMHVVLHTCCYWDYYSTCRFIHGIVLFVNSLSSLFPSLHLPPSLSSFLSLPPLLSLSLSFSVFLSLSLINKC